MKIGLMGRTSQLLEIGQRLAKAGYDIPFIVTCKNTLPYFYCTEEDIKKFAESIGASLFIEPDIYNAEFQKKLQGFDCDISVTFSWLTILKKPIFDCFKRGILNIHGGDLPRYRGNACQTWAILNEETKIGLCVHFMKPSELDNGDIIVKKYMSINDDTYIGDVFEWMWNEAPALYLEAIRKLALYDSADSWERQSTDPHNILRCYPRKPEDGRIEWRVGSRDIRTLVRATSHPYPGAFCYFEGKKMIIWRCNEVEYHGNYLGIPGQLMRLKNNNPAVICGKGILELTDISLETCESHEESSKLILKSARNRLT